MRKTRGLVTGLLLLAAGNAAAIPISYTGFFGADIDIGGYSNDGGPIQASYNLVTVGMLPGFDSSLGTLNSVALSFGSRFAHGMQGRADDDRLTCQDFFCLFTDIEASIDVFNTVRYTAFLANAPGASMTRSFVEHEACSTSSDAFISTIGCHANSAPVVADSFDGTFDLSGYSLASFIDISQLTLGFQFQSILFGTCQNDLGDRCSVLRGGSWNGLYQVTYDYTPGDIDPPDPDPTELPAPNPLLLWATALFGLAITRRRPLRSWL